MSAAADAGHDLGKRFDLDRADGGGRIGSIRFTEVAELPADCIDDDTDIPGSRPLAIRIEIENAGTSIIETPDQALLQVNDADGFTQKTQNVSIADACTQAYPELAGAPAPGKSAGWVAIESPVADPSALVYGALVWSDKASLENWDAVMAKPSSFVARLPKIVAASPAPAAAAPTTTPAPAATAVAQPPVAQVPTTVAPRPAPAVPAAGQSCNPATDGWGTDASGGTLRCGYFGGPTPKWVNSAPLVGTRAIGSACDPSARGVAESPDGTPLVCTSTGPNFDTSTWQPGP